MLFWKARKAAVREEIAKAQRAARNGGSESIITSRETREKRTIPMRPET
jgi:hypothetical protein